VLGSVQRFRKVSDQPFPNRGTVRRGGLAFLSSLLSNEKKCCCIFFEPKAERLAERRGTRPIERKSRAAGRRVEDLKADAERVYETGKEGV
jgi:hypothetical protein